MFQCGSLSYVIVVACFFVLVAFVPQLTAANRRVVAFVHDNENTMRAAGRIITEKQIGMIDVGCADHALDLVFTHVVNKDKKLTRLVESAKGSCTSVKHTHRMPLLDARKGDTVCAGSTSIGVFKANKTIHTWQVVDFATQSQCDDLTMVVVFSTTSNVDLKHLGVKQFLDRNSQKVAFKFKLSCVTTKCEDS